MSETKILHTADWHLGYRQYGLVQREKDIFESAINIIEIAKKNNVNAIVNSGDILHTTRPSAYTISQLSKINDLLVEYNIPMYVISGNHDRTDPHWIEIVNPHRTPNTGILMLDNLNAEVNNVVISGLPEMHKQKFAEVSQDLEECDIFMFHGSIVEFIKFPNPNAFTFDDLPLNKCQYVATGDTHVTSHQTCNNTHIVSPGSIELISSSENELKYVFILTFEGKVLKDIEKQFIKTRGVFKESISTDDDLIHVLDSLDTFCEHNDKPLVYIKYDPEVKDVVAKFSERLKQDKILHLNLEPNFSSSEMKYDLNIEDNNITLSDVLSMMIPEAAPIFSIADTLINSEKSSVDDKIDEYVEKRMKDLSMCN